MQGIEWQAKMPVRREKEGKREAKYIYSEPDDYFSLLDNKKFEHC